MKWYFCEGATWRSNIKCKVFVPGNQRRVKAECHGFDPSWPSAADVQASLVIEAPIDDTMDHDSAGKEAVVVDMTENRCPTI